ncbi:S9 family peptidase [Asticcacaulis sp. AND118]|uniref:S9 family peptidase n=1 Tax=Asticcacaulis sp. AND118 TaxID=2840468 RepID=UPI001D000148|nr:S9 family peptidase [Asticcacaulis sp. AND118]UDF04881.1 S9 family peptidase [Asticcacaulis sp. AND118]
MILMLSVCAPVITHAANPATVQAETPPKAMTAVDLLSLQRASDPRLSPDGRVVLYRVSTSDWKKNRVTLSLWRANADGSEPRLMVDEGGGDLSWSPDSRRFAFVARRGEDKASQIYLMSVDGGEARRLTDSAQNVSDLRWSPDGRFIYFTARSPETKADKKRLSEKDDMFAFEDARTRTQLRRADVVTGKLQTVAGGDFDVKSYDVAADGETVAYVRAPSRLLDDGPFGEVWWQSGTGKARQLTDNNYGESGVKLSPDGRTVLFLANAKDGAYGTVNRNLFALNTETKAVAELGTRATDAPGWEIESAAFAPDGKSVYFTANEGVRATLNRVPVTGGAWQTLVTGDSVVSDVDVSASGRLAYIQSSATSPAELFTFDPRRLQSTQVTHLSDDLKTRFRLPRQEALRWVAPDGQALEGLVTYPLDYVPGKAYPLVVQNHGGPRSVDQFNIFSYGRLNPLLAARGIMTLSVNYRGGTAYGDTFLQGMNGGYFKYADKDVLSGIDELIRRGLADPERLGVMGWSAGGHMTNRLITTTDRFKAAASGAGTVDWTSMYLTSDTRWQRQEWFITPPYGTSARRDLYEEYSALSRLDKVTTPTLIMAGAEDDRVPTAQSIMLYRSLKALGVETELYLAPREPHNFAELRHRLFQVNKHMDWFLSRLTGQDYLWDKAPDSKADGRREDEEEDGPEDASMR